MSIADAVWALLAVIALVTAVAVAAMSLVWLERKLLGRLQGRVGPTRVGPFGLLQPVADAIKLLLKEDVSPGPSARVLFFVSPLLVFVPLFVVWVTVPFAEGLAVRNLDLGLFFFIAFSVLSITGLVLAGWSSTSKYALLGSLRAAAQLVSYEIPLIMVIAGVVMLAGSMDITKVVEAQESVPFVALQPLGFALFLVAGLAEIGRTPFDIYFAESEIVGGPFVEYSGIHWAVFFLAEYANTFLIGILTALLFLGGWAWPFGDLPAPAAVALVLAKAYAVVAVIFWVRASYPRLRIDQLMALGWKVLIPLSFLTVLLTGAQRFYGWPAWTLTLLSAATLAILVVLQARLQLAPARAAARRMADRAVAVRPRPKPAATPAAGAVASGDPEARP